MPDFKLILSSLYCWIFGSSAFVLDCASEKEKDKSVKLVSREGSQGQSLIFLKWYSSHKFSKD